MVSLLILQHQPHVRLSLCFCVLCVCAKRGVLLLLLLLCSYCFFVWMENFLRTLQTATPLVCHSKRDHWLVVQLVRAKSSLGATLQNDP